VEDAKRVCSVRDIDVLNAKGTPINLLGLRTPLDFLWNHEYSRRDCSPFNVSERGSLPNGMFVEFSKCAPQGHVHGCFRILHSIEFRR